MKPKPTKLKYKCVVWYFGPGDLLKLHNADHIVRGRPTMAYGSQPERDDCGSAYADMIALRATTLGLSSAATARGNYTSYASWFVASVVEYPEGGYPPEYIDRQMIFLIDPQDADEYEVASTS